MKLRVMLMVAMLALSAPAFATQPGSLNGNGCDGNCGNGGRGGVGGHGGDGGNGGLGIGQGGSGGDAVAGALAVAGAAALTDVDVRNTNRNTNAQGQIQGQQQGNVNVVGVRGSEQSQTASVGDTTATVGNTSATGGNATGGNATASNAGNSQSITYNEATNKTVRSVGTVEVRSVPTAIAPNVYPTASCAMSASVGASALGWGVSGGGTKVNEECMMLEGARMFSQLGYPIQGIILACSTKSALAVFGTAQACIDASTPKTAAAPVAPVAVVAAQPVKVETTVPFGEVK